MKAVLLTLFVGLTLGCQNLGQKSRLYKEKSETRHGWTVFSGPKRTVIGVNDQNSIARGGKLYSQHCAKCHGPKAKGDGPLAKKLATKPADLTKMTKLQTNYYLVFQINEGTGDMPRWQDILSTSETWDLSNYVQNLSK